MTKTKTAVFFLLQALTTTAAIAMYVTTAGAVHSDLLTNIGIRRDRCIYGKKKMSFFKSSKPLDITLFRIHNYHQ